jgi:ssDNA-binding Zn-finger/Zn-ribbon topoisomerase 1
MTYQCPECDSTEVTLTHEQSFMANTGEHYCHSVKVQDPDSRASCLKCGWEGTHEQLLGYNEETT